MKIFGTILLAVFVGFIGAPLIASAMKSHPFIFASGILVAFGAIGYVAFRPIKLTLVFLFCFVVVAIFVAGPVSAQTWDKTSSVVRVEKEEGWTGTRVKVRVDTDTYTLAPCTVIVVHDYGVALSATDGQIVHHVRLPTSRMPRMEYWKSAPGAPTMLVFAGKEDLISSKCSDLYQYLPDEAKQVMASPFLLAKK